MNMFQILLSLGINREDSSFYPGTFMGQYCYKPISDEDTEKDTEPIGRAFNDTGLGIYDE